MDRKQWRHGRAAILVDTRGRRGGLDELASRTAAEEALRRTGTRIRNLHAPATRQILTDKAPVLAETAIRRGLF